MSKAPTYWKKARTYLSKKDSIMRSLIKKYKDNNLTTRKDVFYSLCKSIIGQQISVAAADSVFKKFELACKKKINPKTVSKLKTSDEEAIIYLSTLRQIGRWSAEMILLFTYNRSNIWPVQDIGLLRAISNNYKKKYFPPEIFVKKLQKRFSPYCSVATWYLWRSIDDDTIQY
jgi:DNA-3-methyladenine glycosylase II